MKTPLTVIMGVLGVLFLIVVLVLGLGVSGHLDSNTTPLIVTVLGMTAPTIASLLSLFKSEQTHNSVTNGAISDSVTSALEASNIPGGNTLRTPAQSIPVDVVNVAAPSSTTFQGGNPR